MVYPAPVDRNNRIRQLSGMRGLMAKPSGEVIETPITSNFRTKASTMLQYRPHARRAEDLADTALKTADSGYLTRGVCGRGAGRDHQRNLDCGHRRRDFLRLFR